MERNEWIKNYLKGKIVKLSELEDFFTIENGEKKIIIDNKKIDTITYITNYFSYAIDIKPFENKSTMYKILDITIKEII